MKRRWAVILSRGGMLAWFVDGRGTLFTTEENAKHWAKQMGGRAAEFK